MTLLASGTGSLPVLKPLPPSRLAACSTSAVALEVQVVNQNTGETLDTSCSGDSRFSGVWADLDRQPVIHAGDRLDVQVSDATGLVGKLPYRVSPEDIRWAYVTIPIDIRQLED